MRSSAHLVDYNLLFTCVYRKMGRHRNPCEPIAYGYKWKPAAGGDGDTSDTFAT